VSYLKTNLASAMCDLVDSASRRDIVFEMRIFISF